MELSNKLLIALPNLNDEGFKKAVIYICSHNENGSLGLIINYPSENLTVGDTLAHLNLPEYDIETLKEQENMMSNGGHTSVEMPPHLFDIPVLNGGPVEHNRGFILHSKDYNLGEQTIDISGTISMTSTADILSDISLGKGPKQLCFAIGYVGWDANQLEEEINQNSWLISDVDDELVFSQEYDDKYEKSMLLLGIRPDMMGSISASVGNA